MVTLNRVVDARLRKEAVVDDTQDDFMRGRGTTNASFIIRQLQGKKNIGGKNKDVLTVPGDAVY